MSNRFKLQNILISKNRIEYDYEVSGEWRRYFNLCNKLYVEYSIDIGSVPQSVALIPLLCMILPIAWICDAEIIVDEIDKDFYCNIDNIKKGYRDMYPMLQFNGKINGKPTENITLKSNINSAVFFSGGVDAFHTLIRHLPERPVLLTIWGADVRLDDEDGWAKVSNHVENVSKEFGLRNLFIKSNFRSAIYENKLGRLVKKSKDSWWHGFYCGIGIIGLASISAYVLGLKSLYIASSFSDFMKGQYTCGSDPTIDNYINFCGCKTIHDAYEYDRQSKVRELCEYMRKSNQKLKIRVCWSSSGGSNCCECEKCYRTIMEFISEGIDPNLIGFLWNNSKKVLFRKNMTNSIVMSRTSWIARWEPIKNKLIKQKRLGEEYSWLINMSYDEFMSSPIKKMKRTIFYRLWKKVIKNGEF